MFLCSCFFLLPHSVTEKFLSGADIDMKKTISCFLDLDEYEQK